jgi:hypothetical protein
MANCHGMNVPPEACALLHTGNSKARQMPLFDANLHH